VAKRRILWTLIGGVCFFLLIQAVPYGRDHSNPPVVAEPKWDSAESRALAVRACYDCHSNESVWPWYSDVAPFSWLIQRDVDGGRRRLNFSDWTSNTRRADRLARALAEGQMPPFYYVWMHPSAQLTTAEAAQLSSALSSLVASR
jgi:Haem-binding domain